MKYEPTCRYRKCGDGYESRIFQTIAEIPENEGWCGHWMDFEESDIESDNDVIAGNEYDRETLEMIFDQEGINGLRIVGMHFKVKSKSKDGLIKRILEAQGDTE